MAKLIVPDVIVVAGRTEDFEWSAFQTDGRTAVVFEAGDKVRFKLARKPDGAPVVDLLSGTPTAGGSSVVITELGDAGDNEPASGTVRLAQADTVDFEGDYHFELNLVDSGESNPANAIKQFLRGKMTFLPSQGGNVGL